ncbi:ribosomal protein L7/L12 [Enhygromyxa salina]|uniref:50S ribosomal protein L7/L12 n=1 Tax=Enhygromyxa salina TaxID=215803 RepID=A0A2S9YVL6_9BACT|nr:ribosomal protein L7/L12 [Enhygromyxa salina]PRQ09145.1 50S ribosomal protein L7/L12 [Enhygromyxa salina]
MEEMDSVDPTIGQLARALDARGFERFVSVRVQAPARRKITTIKEVRILTGMGLKLAKDAVEQGQIILDAVPPSLAAHACERLGRFGATTSIEHAHAHRYAFAPSHDRRGEQVCERLSVIGVELVCTRGHLGAWGHNVATRPGDGGLEALLEAIDRQRHRWAVAGLVEAGSEVEILSRVSARDRALELEMAETEPEGGALERTAAVYSDWLQAQGDPRGLVGAAALALDGAADPERAQQRSRELARVVDEHAPHLLGPARGIIGHASLRWAGPNITDAQLPTRDASGPLHANTLLERFLLLPVAAGLRRLTLAGSFTQHPALGDLLAGSSCATSLRALDLSELRRLTLHDACFERLRELSLDALELELEQVSTPALNALRVVLRFPGDDITSTFAGLDAPRLEHFEFGTQTYDYWDEHQGPLQRHLLATLQLPCFAKLRSLTLRSLGESLPYHTGLAQMLERIPAIATLERIDLREARIASGVRAEFEARRAQLPGLLLPP